jgi:hypothetical protein
MRSRESIGAVQNRKVSVCGGRGGECPHYPACKAHAHYYVIFGLVVLPYISTLSHKRQEFREKLTEQKVCTFISSGVFTWNISRIKNNSARCYHKCTYVYMQSTRCSCRILIFFNFATDFRRFLKYQISWNTSSMRTDIKLIVAFLKFPKAPKNWKSLNILHRIWIL